MDASALIAQLRAARLRWHDVAPGVRIQLDTPSAVAVMRLSSMMQSLDDRAITEVARLVRGWEGITTRLLQGAGVGTDETAPVSAEIAEILLADRPDWWTALVHAAIKQGSEAIAAAKATAGN